MLRDHRHLFCLYTKNKDVSIRNRLVEANLPLAKKAAFEWTRKCKEPYSDLEQIASMALVSAVENYDPTSGWKFSCYAIPTINGKIQHHLRDKANLIKVPRKYHDLHEKAQRFIRKNPQADKAAIAEYLRIPVEEWEDVILSRSASSPSSLDLDDGSLDIGVEDKGSGHDWDQFFANLSCLSPDERQLFQDFVWGKSMKQISKDTGFSIQEIQISLEKIMAKNNPDFSKIYTGLAPGDQRILTLYKNRLGCEGYPSRELAEILGFDKTQAITNALSRLAEAGFVIRPQPNKRNYALNPDAREFVSSLPDPVIEKKKPLLDRIFDEVFATQEKALEERLKAKLTKWMSEQLKQ